MSYGGGPGYCLTGARFNMSATVLHQNDSLDPSFPDPDEYGEWVRSQDPLTNEIVKIWVPFPDDPETPENEEEVYDNIPCIARGIVDGGIRVAGTTEWFGVDYRNIDFVKLWVPAHIQISKRDRVTNIRDSKGHIRWVNEEYARDEGTGEYKATVFNVNGVTPLFNASNIMTEQFVLLENAEVQEETV